MSNKMTTPLRPPTECPHCHAALRGWAALGQHVRDTGNAPFVEGRCPVLFAARASTRLMTAADDLARKRAEWQRQRDRFAPSGGTDYLVACGALEALDWVRDELLGITP